MTWLETEDVEKELKRQAWRNTERPLLEKAAEAIEWLREQLEQDEGYIEWLEVER